MYRFSNSYRVLEPGYTASFDPHNRSRIMDGSEQYNLRELLTDTTSRHRFRRSRHFIGRFHWIMFSRGLCSVAVPGCDAATDRHADGPDTVRVRRHEPRGGVEVPGRVYREYRLEDYSPWLRNRIKDAAYWNTIRSCILGSRTCAQLAYWTPLDYMQRDMSPIQSGYCKPSTACNYNSGTMMESQDPDCYRWNNSPSLLCYECDSCKAGLLESMRRDWHKVSMLSVIILVLLIGIYCIS